MGRLADFFREQSIPLAGQQKTKMLSLDREFEKMQAERDALKTENLHLQAKVNPLKRDIEQMQAQIQRAEATAAARDEKLDEKAVRLLAAIANRGRGTAAAILGSTPAEADLYVNRLTARGFIRNIFSYTGQGGLTATPEGLEYLHKIGRL